MFTLTAAEIAEIATTDVYFIKRRKASMRFGGASIEVANRYIIEDVAVEHFNGEEDSPEFKQMVKAALAIASSKFAA